MVAVTCWITDRKSTRLNSSHLVISYAVFCLKKKNRPSDEQTSRLTSLDQHWHERTGQVHRGHEFHAHHPLPVGRVQLPCAAGYFFFFIDAATTEIYTLSLHDALPISFTSGTTGTPKGVMHSDNTLLANGRLVDRKSTRLNSSHLVISYAVFCLKK